MQSWWFVIIVMWSRLIYDFCVLYEVRCNHTAGALIMLRKWMQRYYANAPAHFDIPTSSSCCFHSALSLEKQRRRARSRTPIYAICTYSSFPFHILTHMKNEAKATRTHKTREINIHQKTSMLFKFINFNVCVCVCGAPLEVKIKKIKK